MTKTRFTGDPVEDMEIAKRMIGKHPNVDIGGLITVAADQTQPLSARIAAVYTLGFTDDTGRSKATLARIVNDPKESPEVKDHAEEAWGYLSHKHTADPVP